eukprot:2320030-Amphidinium_carterae.1
MSQYHNSIAPITINRIDCALVFVLAPWFLANRCRICAYVISSRKATWSTLKSLNTDDVTMLR